MINAIHETAVTEITRESREAKAALLLLRELQSCLHTVCIDNSTGVHAKLTVS